MSDDRPPSLVDALTALASPVRLGLLSHLREPRTLSDIHARPARRDPEGNVPDRPMARQTVKRHLAQLIESGVVNTQEGAHDGSPAGSVRYVVNHQSLFLVAEHVRSLATLRPAVAPDHRTIPSAPGLAPGDTRGPCLMMVRGLDEGETYPLVRDPGRPPTWVIGRRPALAVSIDFDPSVSAENAEIRLEDDGYCVYDIAGSRNGTTVNFRPLPPGGRRLLRDGDVIGVGRCLLLFRHRPQPPADE